MSADQDALPLPFESAAVPEWITAEQTAELANVTEQAVRAAFAKCATGGTWRSHALKVRTRDGGPASAQNPYLVHVLSLPPALSGAYIEKMNRLYPAAPVKLGPKVEMPEQVEPNGSRKLAEMKWKLSILAPALEFDEGSPGRQEWMRELSKQKHIGLDGKPRQYTLRTLYGWLKKIKDAKSVYGLMRKSRVEGDRAIICRRWDKACPLPDETKREIATEIRQYVRSLWAEGPGWNTVEQLASSKLMEISRAAGWAEASYKDCRVGRHYVDKHSETKLIAIKEKDAKRWHDEFAPRVKRTRAGLRPGDIVVGDVHPVDVTVTRPDGSEATFRLIAWYDIATGDLFASLVLLAPGKGITQAHIAASFAAMVEAWGLPRLLMLDNGSEYSWRELERGFAELASLAKAMKIPMSFQIRDDEDAIPFMDDAEDVAEREFPILRALPHRPASKPVEGIFAVLEELILQAFPGWIGGDRMNKKTHRMGKAPRPFPGTPEDFEATFAEAMRFWRTRERRAWSGKSVNEVREAFQSDGGPLPPSVAREALVFALSEEMTRKVGTWGVQVGGNDQWYRSPPLLKYTGQNVTLRYAKWAPDYLFLMGEQGMPVKVPRLAVHGYTDGEGARHQAAMNKILNAEVRELKSTTRKVAVLEEMTRHVDAVGKDVPVLKGPEIQLAGDLAAASLPAPEGESVHLEYGEALDRKTGEVVTTIRDYYGERHPPAADTDDEPDWESLAKRFAQTERLDGEATPPSPKSNMRDTGATR